MSTEEQHQSGLSLESQRGIIESYAAANQWTLVTIEQDIASGKAKNGRPGLERALELCETGETEVLIAVKLDRLSRSVIHFQGLLDQAEAGGFAIVTCDGIVPLTSSAAGRLVANLMSAVAAWEADAISERTTLALQAAKARGVKLGRAAQGDKMLADGTLQLILDLREQGHSLQKVAEILTTEGIPTPMGGAVWRKDSLSKLLIRRGYYSPSPLGGRPPGPRRTT